MIQKVHGGWSARAGAACSAFAVLNHVQLSTGLCSLVFTSRWSQTTHLVLQIGRELSGAGTSLSTSQADNGLVQGPQQ